MGVLTDFVVAKADEADAVARSSCPYQDFPGFAAPRIDERMLGSLNAILTGDPSTSDFMDSSLRAAHTQEGPWVFEVPPALVSQLAELGPKQSADVAVAWVQAEGVSLEPSILVEASRCVEDLADLSRQAIAEGKCLFMWVCL